MTKFRETLSKPSTWKSLLENPHANVAPLLCSLCSLLLGTGLISADTIEFEPGVTGTITATAGSGVGQYVEDGVTVDAIDAQDGKHFHLYQDFTPGPSTWILIFTSDSHGVVFSFGGIAVDLISVDFWAAVPGTLTSSTGGTASYVKPPSSPFGVGSIDFTALSGWTGITSFTWTFTDPSVIGQDDIPSGLDNLVFRPSAVPEPATWMLMLTGLVLLRFRFRTCLLACFPWFAAHLLDRR